MLECLYIPYTLGNNHFGNYHYKSVRVDAPIEQVASAMLKIFHEVHPVQGFQQAEDYPETFHTFACDLFGLSMVDRSNTGQFGAHAERSVPDHRESIVEITYGQERMIPLLRLLLKKEASHLGLNFTYQDIDFSIPYVDDLIHLYILFFSEFDPSYLDGQDPFEALFEHEVSQYVDIPKGYSLKQILTPFALEKMKHGFRKLLRKAHNVHYKKFTQENAAILDLIYDCPAYEDARVQHDYIQMTPENIRAEYQTQIYFQYHDPKAYQSKFATLQDRMREKLAKKQDHHYYQSRKQTALTVHEFLENPSLLLFFARWLRENF
ncbi:MAG: hypothetical protein OXT67_13560, partial [Zetaproteobacteria bacterium]|nr:hypothetical protein [Zetaproteobacteria bacterium]